MKIRTSKDVEKLDQKIQDELGIQVSKYRNEEVAENFVDLLVFPAYALNWMVRAMLINLALYVAGFFVMDLEAIGGTVYTILGLVLFIVEGVLTGLLFLLWKIKKDLFGIIEYTLDILKSSVEDLGKAKHKINAENRKQVLGMLFKGIIHIVTIPVISSVIGKKIPLIGGMVAGIIRKILTYVAGAIKFSDYQSEEGEEHGQAFKISGYIKSINATRKGIDVLLSVAMRVAQTPIAIVFFVITMILMTLLWFVW